MKMTTSNQQVIKGDVTAKDHEGWIEISSLMFVLAPSRSGGDGDGSGSGGADDLMAPLFLPLEITKAHDGASAALFRESSLGELVTVQIDFVAQDSGSDGLPPFQSIFLDGVVVASVNVKSSGNPPTEGLSLSFSKVSVVYPALEAALHEGEDDYDHLAGQVYSGGP
jgi:type VI protein secretion system component Hcp